MKHVINHIHFVGIGGSGMSGIAEVLINLGYEVSGSDISESATVKRLRSLGATVAVGHAAANIHGADAVVTSTAVQADNPEVVAAHEAEARVRVRVFEETRLARRKVIPAGHPHPVGQQAVNQIGADESGGAGDECVLHGAKGA